MEDTPALDALVRQLQQSAEITDDLRFLLKEDRQRLMFAELHRDNLQQHVQSLEGVAGDLQRRLAEREAEVEELTRALASLQSIHGSRWWRWYDRVQSARQAKGSLTRLVRRLRRGGP